MSRGRKSRRPPWEQRYPIPPALAWQPNFDVKAWKVSDRMLKWKSDYIDNPGSKHPKPLVVVAPPRSGKTEWAMSFGRPIAMVGGLNVKELDRTGWTHLVLNDILSEHEFMKKIASRQKMAKGVGRYAGQHPKSFNKPVIFTFDQNNPVWQNERFHRYLSKLEAVIVETSEKLF